VIGFWILDFGFWIGKEYKLLHSNLSVEFVTKRYTRIKLKGDKSMSTPNQDEVEGKVENVKGKVKEGVGNLTGNRDLEAEGEADQAAGKTQETWGKFKHGVGDAVDAVGDAVSNTGKEINK
jgi:uncharacterized protein YjbJ (UPF0337 family)